MKSLAEVKKEMRKQTIENLRREIEDGPMSCEISCLLAVLAARKIRENDYLEHFDGCALDLVVNALGCETVDDILRNQREWYSMLQNADNKAREIREEKLIPLLQNVEAFRGDIHG